MVMRIDEQSSGTRCPLLLTSLLTSSHSPRDDLAMDRSSSSQRAMIEGDPQCDWSGECRIDVVLDIKLDGDIDMDVKRPMLMLVVLQHRKRRVGQIATERRTSGI